jgi:hypothetical protein
MPVDRVPATGLGAGLLLAVTLVVVFVAVGRAGGSGTQPSSHAGSVVGQPGTSRSAQPGPLSGSREPTVTDAAEFAMSYQLPGAAAKRMVAANTNTDNRREIVFAVVTGGISRVEVAAWDGKGYHIVGKGRGGPATEIVDLWVRDVTKDKVSEIIVIQRTEQSRSVSIWGWDGARYAPQVAVGGCADGGNTFGVHGAEVGMGTITATCDASPQPRKNVYTWNARAQAWVSKEPGGPTR